MVFDIYSAVAHDFGFNGNPSDGFSDIKRILKHLSRQLEGKHREIEYLNMHMEKHVEK